MEFKIVICVCVILGSARVESRIHKNVGDTLTLTSDNSSFSDSIKRITWKLGKNKVAEMDLDFVPNVVNYGSFKDRTTLDTQTGKLVIADLRTSDTGVYSLELNGKEQNTSFYILVMREVPEPKITEKCETPKTSCTLTCEGDTTGAEPVTYSWRGEEVLSGTDKKLTVTGDDHKIKMYACQIKNPVSQKDSTHHKNPFYPDGLPEKARLGISVFIVFLCTVVLAVFVHRYMSGVWFYQKESMPWEAAFWTKDPEYGAAAGNKSLDNNTTTTEVLMTGEPDGTNGTNRPAEGDKL